MTATATDSIQRHLCATFHVGDVNAGARSCSLHQIPREQSRGHSGASMTASQSSSDASARLIDNVVKIDAPRSNLRFMVRGYDEYATHTATDTPPIEAPSGTDEEYSIKHDVQDVLCEPKASTHIAAPAAQIPEDKPILCPRVQAVTQNTDFLFDATAATRRLHNLYSTHCPQKLPQIPAMIQKIEDKVAQTTISDSRTSEQ